MTLPNLLEDHRLKAAVQLALDEDIGSGDATTLSLVRDDAIAEGVILTRQDTRVSGNDVAAAVMHAISPDITTKIIIPDGNDAKAGESILAFRGPARAILTAERTALNFMQRMCGIATLTSTFTKQVADLGTLILDTRKTTPGLRFLEKYAVLCGGGTNHRFGLFDRILMKDNHRRLWADFREGRLDLAVLESRRQYPNLCVEIEVESLEELQSALPGKPEWIMLDNMSCDLMREAVRICNHRAKLEASGGITLKNVRAVAETGVDAISLGCLTHSAPSIDLSLEWTIV